MKNKGDSLKDKKKKKRKKEQMDAFGHSSNSKKLNPNKIHKQKNHRKRKSDQKYHKGGNK